MQVHSEDTPLSSTVTAVPTQEEQKHWLPAMWDAVERDVILPVLTSAVHKDRADSIVPMVQTTGTAQTDADSTAVDETGTAMAVAFVAPSRVAFQAVFDGVLISAPGADTQHWHRDSGLHSNHISHYTIYIATADVSSLMGPTQFLPGTNRDLGFAFEDWTSFFDYCDTTRTPLLNAGKKLHFYCAIPNDDAAPVLQMLYCGIRRVQHCFDWWCLYRQLVCKLKLLY